MHPQQPIQAGDLKVFQRHRAVAVARLLQFGRDLLQFEAARLERHETIEKFLWQRLRDSLECFLRRNRGRRAGLLGLLGIDIRLKLGMRAEQPEIGNSTAAATAKSASGIGVSSANALAAPNHKRFQRFRKAVLRYLPNPTGRSAIYFDSALACASNCAIRSRI